MNQDKINKIINNTILGKIFMYVIDNSLEKSNIYINKMCINYNIENEKICKQLFTYIIENKTIKTGKISDLLNEIEIILHNNNNNNSSIIVNYTITVLKKYF